MAPSATTNHPPQGSIGSFHAKETVTSERGSTIAKTRNVTPLRLSGVLDQFQHEDTTPLVGREYIGVNIVDDILNAEDSDARLKDLAITISQRGVAFFRAQDNLTDDLQKSLVDRLATLAGRPESSSLHVHPVLNNTNEFGAADPEVSTISSLGRKKLETKELQNQPKGKKYHANQWHSDIQFEHVPSDYTSLRLTLLPKTGGDTLFASGYEIYERISPRYQKLLDGLTATYVGDAFHEARDRGVKVYKGPRGSPENIGDDLSATHPVVRTNPVTGWKSIYAIGPFIKQINGIYKDESDELVKRFLRFVTEDHDLQARFKWRNKNDIAIWDNRSFFHTPIFDYDGLGDRHGVRTVSIGEKPYFDPNSRSRSEALAEEAEN